MPPNYRFVKQRQSRSRVGVCVNMKTKFQVLSEEQVKSLNSLINGTEKRTMSYSFVLKEIRKDLKKNGAVDIANTIDENWKRFLELWALQMPHVIYNGSKVPTVVDWVEDPEGKFKLEKAIKSYRYTDDEEVKVEGCTDGRIKREVTCKMMEVITYASGFSKEVPSLDEEGKPITETTTKTFVPKEKSAWGFTKTLVAAFIAATDDLLCELASKVSEPENEDE